LSKLARQDAGPGGRTQALLLTRMPGTHMHGGTHTQA